MKTDNLINVRDTVYNVIVTLKRLEGKIRSNDRSCVFNALNDLGNARHTLPLDDDRRNVIQSMMDCIYQFITETPPDFLAQRHCAIEKGITLIDWIDNELYEGFDAMPDEDLVSLLRFECNQSKAMLLKELILDRMSQSTGSTEALSELSKSLAKIIKFMEEQVSEIPKTLEQAQNTLNLYAKIDALKEVQLKISMLTNKARRIIQQDGTQPKVSMMTKQGARKGEAVIHDN